MENMENSRELLNALRIERAPVVPPRGRRFGLWLAVIGASIAVLPVAVYGVWKFTRDEAVPVQIAEVRRIGTSASVLDATGYVTARRTATVSSKVTGRVKTVLIEEGQHVAAGQVMATLDPIDAEAQRKLVAAELEVAQSQQASLRAQLKQAEADATRYKDLAARQFVSSSAVDQYVSRRDVLLAQLETTQRSIQVARNQVGIAEYSLDNTVIRAPFSGVVIAKAAQPGEIVSPLSAGGGFTRTGIGTLVDMDSLEIEVNVSEAYIGRVLPKMPVNALLNAYPEWNIPAEVIVIIPSADRSKATVKVRIALKTKDPRIVPEMGVKVSFLESKNVSDEQHAGVRIPETAVVQRDGVPVAFVVRADQKAERRALKLGRAMNEDRQALAGVAAGESVILAPSPALVEGAQVRVVAPGAAPVN